MTRVIKALPKNIADKIAAGEVIERPLSVVKELLENALDADSTSVTVEISKGGKELIRVTDNGCGIASEQMVLAFKRYATSKIAKEEDLDNINTLGFRGEALASIAAVSRIELISKTAEQTSGCKVVLEEGELVEQTDCACENGTTIIVRDLFYNLPARHKFLKNDSTESGLIIDFISKMALAYPGVKIRLISNGTILFATQGNNDLYKTILTVYSAQTAKSLVPVNSNSADMGVCGYISSPIESKTNRKWQIYFVNGRLIKSKVLDEAISVAYKDKMFEGRYPMAFLFINIDPSKIDVNIHPSKAEIKFFNEEDIIQFIVKSVRKALLNPAALEKHIDVESKVVTRSVETFKDNSELNKNSDSNINTTKSNVVIGEQKTEDDFFEKLRQTSDDELSKSVELPHTNVAFEKSVDSSYPEIKSKPVYVQEEMFESNKPDKFSFAALNYIGQAFSTYLIFKDGDNIYFLDQHAAHERVMFERLMKRFNSAEIGSQPILSPIVISLTRAALASSNESISILSSIGFDIAEFGPDSYIVKAIPACLAMDEAEDFLNSFFNTASEYTNNIQLKLEEIMSNSCKAAVKAHDHLSVSEVDALMKDLDTCDNPFSCPHGRPTFIKFTNYEIERMFKRK